MGRGGALMLSSPECPSEETQAGSQEKIQIHSESQEQTRDFLFMKHSYFYAFSGTSGN